MKKESKTIRFLYNTVIGRIILKIFSMRFVARISGAFLNSRFSKFLISSFIKKNKIKIEEYEEEHYKSFNAFFTRKIKKDLRPIDWEKKNLISPCDGFLSAYQIKEGLVLPVKQSQYTISSLLKNETLSKKYKEGICVVLRLCVEHYHRYCYIDWGTKGKNTFIPGKLHTVRPIALEKMPVFSQNCREYTVMQTENFRSVTQIEVGAMFVGKIKNYHEDATFSKGEEKGMFLFGGSTIILLFEKDAVKLDPNYFLSTNENKEVPVKMGEKIGEAK